MKELKETETLLEEFEITGEPTELPDEACGLLLICGFVQAGNATLYLCENLRIAQTLFNNYKRIGTRIADGIVWYTINKKDYERLVA